MLGKCDHEWWVCQGLEGETTVKLSVDSITWPRLKPYFLNPNIKQHNYSILSGITLFQSLSITTPTMRIIQQILRTKCMLQTCKNFGTLLSCIITSQYHKFFPLLCDLHTLAFIKFQWIGGSHKYCGGTCQLKFQVIYTRLQGIASYSDLLKPLQWMEHCWNQCV